MNQNENMNDDRDLEQRICDELCDVLDMPECYEDCVLGIHKVTHEVHVAEPAGFTKEYVTFPLLDMFEVEEDSQELEVDIDAVHDVASRFE